MVAGTEYGVPELGPDGEPKGDEGGDEGDAAGEGLEGLVYAHGEGYYLPDGPPRHDGSDGPGDGGDSDGPGPESR